MILVMAMVGNTLPPPRVNGHPPNESRRRRWLGVPLEPPIDGTIAAVIQALPQFGRQPFSMASANGGDVGVNPYMDTIYRVPLQQGLKCVPVGVVSKNYRLIDHHQVLRTVEDALRDAGIEPDEVHVRGTWTIHGERAHFSVLLPADEKYQFLLGENDEVRFRIEIVNSVEGSCRFMALAGWLRFVCSNGLIIGTILAHIRQQHRQQLQIEDFGKLLEENLRTAMDERATLKEWANAGVIPEVLVEWADNAVCKKWGVKAAVRTLSLVLDGVDAKLSGDTRGRKASEIERESNGAVPGLNGPAITIFDVGQALSWLAGQRTDIAEEIEWRTDVATLMQLLHPRRDGNGQSVR